MARSTALRHTQRMLELHFAGYQPARSVHTRALHALRDTVAHRSNGALSIKVTDSIVAQGHKATDLLGMVESGELDGCYFASSYLAARVPALGVFDRPFQADARAAVFSQLDGALGSSLVDAVAAATDYRVLGWWDNGVRHISNSVRPIRTPADCAGLRLRTLDNSRHQEAFRRLGFQPLFVDVADLAQAVADRTLDAQENPLTNMVNFGLQAHHRHVSLTGHLLGITALLVNRARLDTLSGPLREVLIACSQTCEQMQRALAVAEDAASCQLLSHAGVSIVAAEDIDLAAFRVVAADPTSVPRIAAIVGFGGSAQIS